MPGSMSHDSILFQGACASDPRHPPSLPGTQADVLGVVMLVVMLWLALMLSTAAVVCLAAIVFRLVRTTGN